MYEKGRQTLTQLQKKYGWHDRDIERLQTMIDVSPLPIERQPERPAYQAPFRWYMPGLTAEPFHDAKQFPFIQRLEEAYSAIKKEFDHLYEEGLIGPHRENAVNTAAGYWGEFNIYNFGKQSSGSTLIPRTLDALRSLPGTEEMSLAYFSVLYPETRIKPHYAPFNMRLRIHLPLSIPSSCGMRVAGKNITWQEGKCIVFDDSFLHHVWNDSATIRVLLLADFWHPDLTEIERHVLVHILALH